MNRVEKLRDEEGKVKYFKIKKEEYEKGKEKNTNKENSCEAGEVYRLVGWVGGVLMA